MKCKCGKSMKIRTNKKDGNKFWGCTGYPRCKNTKKFTDSTKKITERESLGESMIQWCVDFWNKSSHTQQRNTRKKVTSKPGKIEELSQEIQLEIILMHGTKELIRTVKDDQYSLYLQSEEWKEKRELVIERDYNACRICGSEENLQVHHLTYDRIYNESPYDLVTVCKFCHKRIHS